MSAQGFHLFDTAVGRCGIAWGGRGIVGLQLPEARETETRARLLKKAPNAAESDPPIEVRRAVDEIIALLRGEVRDLLAIKLDMSTVPDFHRRVYETARAIPPGATLSYGEVAAKMGAKGAARAVGQALGRNPFAIIVPCHRVLAAGGKLGGFSANGGITTKLRLLTMEGVKEKEPDLLKKDEHPLGFDPDVAIAHLRQADPDLGKMIDRIGPFLMRHDGNSSIFATLARSIVYQQLSGKAAATIFARVTTLFPRSRQGFTPEHILRVSDEKLRGAGLSRAKVLALRDLARKTADGDIPTLAQTRKMNDEEIIERLVSVRGIGRWTAEMFMMFRLSRPDILPLDDLAIRKGIAVVMRKRTIPSKAEMEKRGRKWQPYRTVASWYLWRVSELPEAKVLKP